MGVVTERGCPQCETRLPVHEGYVTWCHECGWNVTAPEAPASGGRLDRLYAAAGRRLGDRLADSLVAEERLHPRSTPSKVAAYVLAGGVYAFAFALVLGGAALATVGFPNPFFLVVAAIMVGTGVLMRPRLGRPPKEDVVERERAPALYGLVDAVARTLGVPMVDVIVVDRAWNAGWSILGLARRRVLTLGLPVLAALEPQERVAVVGHELAHGKNGDATRGIFVGSAVRGLAELYWLLEPDEPSGEREWDLGIFERVVNALMWLLSRPVYGLLLLELHLLLRDSQRAEYLADALAATVAGSDAVIAAHEKLLLESTFWATVRRAAREGPDGEADVFALLAEEVRGVHPRERERRRRAARLETARLGDSHPPTAKRIDLLERRKRRDAAVVLDDAASARIDEELGWRRAELGRELVEDYRDSLYAA